MVLSSLLMEFVLFGGAGGVDFFHLSDGVLLALPSYTSGCRKISAAWYVSPTGENCARIEPWHEFCLFRTEPSNISASKLTPTVDPPLARLLLVQQGFGATCGGLILTGEERDESGAGEGGGSKNFVGVF